MVSIIVGMSLVFPLFPRLQEVYGFSTASLGPVVAASFVSGLVVELAFAPQADRGHARRMAVIALVLVALSLLWSAVVTRPWELTAARAVGGAGLGLFTPAIAGTLIRQDPTRSGESLGRLGAADLAGWSVGPLLAAGALEWFEPRAVFVGGAVLVACSAALVAGGLRGLAAYPVIIEPLVVGPEVDDASVERPGPAPALAFDLLRSQRVCGAALLTVAAMIPIGAYDAIWPRFMADIGAAPLLIGLSYSVFAVPFIVVAGPAGRLADRIGGGAVYARGAVILLSFTVAYALIRNPWLATGVGFAESTAQAFVFIGAGAAMAQAVDPVRASSAQGLSRAAGLAAAAVVSAFSGWVYASGGPGLLFGGTAILVVAVSGLAWIFLRKQQL
ncbi:MAG: MFS transporter [Actinomycetota bacterium]